MNKDKIIEKIENLEYKQCEADEHLVYKFITNVSIMSDDAIPKFKKGHILRLYILNAEKEEMELFGIFGGSYKEILNAINFLQLKEI